MTATEGDGATDADTWVDGAGGAVDAPGVAVDGTSFAVEVPAGEAAPAQPATTITITPRIAENRCMVLPPDRHAPALLGASVGRSSGCRPFGRRESGSRLPPADVADPGGVDAACSAGTTTRTSDPSGDTTATPPGAIRRGSPPGEDVSAVGGPAEVHRVLEDPMRVGPVAVGHPEVPSDVEGVPTMNEMSVPSGDEATAVANRDRRSVCVLVPEGDVRAPVRARSSRRW